MLDVVQDRCGRELVRFTSLRPKGRTSSPENFLASVSSLGPHPCAPGGAYPGAAKHSQPNSFLEPLLLVSLK